MSEMNRRSFLKILGIGGASTATACQVSWDPKVPLENVLPYVVQPEQIIPGLSTYYATRCAECDSGCGVIARTREGRAVKLEGNPNHPTNKGSLCARGQAALQAPYSPDRFEGPRKGGAAMTWDDAMAAAVTAVQSARAGGKAVAWLGRHRTGASGEVVRQFMTAAGGQMLLWEPLGRASLQAASRAVFGRDALPRFVLDGAHTIISFGADFLGSWGSMVEQTRGYANSRDPAVGGFVSRFVAIEPHASATSALADTLLLVKPGTEAGVALALARLVAEKKGYSGPALALVSGADPAAAAAAAGIDAARLTQVADWIAAGPSVVLPSGTTTSSDPAALDTAALLLNEVAGNIGTSVVYGAELNSAGRASDQQVLTLLADAAAGRVGVLFLDDVDPVFALPPDAGAAAALAAVGQVIAFANEPSDSLGENTLILPPGTALERWGDGEAIRGRYTLQQPVMRPLKDTRSAEDVVLALSRGLGLSAAPTSAPTPSAVMPVGTNAVPAAATPGGAAPGVTPATGAPDDVPGVPAMESDTLPGDPATGSAPAGVDPGANVTGVSPAPTVGLPGLAAADFRTYLADWWKAVVWPIAGGTSTQAGTFGAFWTQTLQRGGHFVETPAAAVSVVLGALPAAAAAEPAGSGEYTLLPFPHRHLGDGSGANRPWLQEIPDGVTQFAWGTWIEINHKKAADLGLEKDGSAILKTDKGQIEVGWFPSKSMREDAVAVVMGNGHASGGRYAGFGANPMQLLTTSVDAASGALRYVVAKASVSKGSAQNTPTNYLVDPANISGRPSINHAVSVEDLGKGTGPGTVVPIHHVPIDERVEKHLGMVDMYAEPNHPTYRFAMAFDLNRCTGCGACQAACYAENNIPVVGPEQTRLGRQMGWIRLSRYWQGEGESPDLRYQPVPCQHCSHAPCEGVCPVLATYHNLDGLNAMVYNRCVGTRYCANNCPYSARRFNYHTYRWPDSFNLMLNPDVVVREMGVMEKCTFCVQRLRDVKDTYRDAKQTVPEEALHKLTACAAACPADVITFGNVKTEGGPVHQKFADERAYTMLGELNNKPGVRYLGRILHVPSLMAAAHHGGSDGHGSGAHGDAGEHDRRHGEPHGGSGSHGEPTEGAGEKPAENHGNGH